MAGIIKEISKQDASELVELATRTFMTRLVLTMMTMILINFLKIIILWKNLHKRLTM